MQPERPVAFLMPGPLHLFWTSGVYHLLNLVETHDVVMIVADARYEGDSRFARMREQVPVREVLMLPSGRPWKRHGEILRLYRDLVARYLPDTVLTNNVNFVENMYLLRSVRVRYPNCRLIYFQNGRTTANLALDFDYRKAGDAEMIAGRLRIPLGIAKSLTDCRNLAASWLNYRALPLWLGNGRLEPVIDVYRGTLTPSNAAQWIGPRDEVWAYLEGDAAVYRHEGYGNVRVVDHPARRQAVRVLSILGETLEVEPRILVLPSYGFTSGLRTNMSAEVVIEKVAGGWVEALKELAAEHPGYQIAMKLHPSAAKDSIWREVIERLQAEFPNISILPPARSAEFLILQSQVIAGDVSSALWWACLVGEKKVVSFDYFGYPGGDELSTVDGIEVRTNRIRQPADPLPVS